MKYKKLSDCPAFLRGYLTAALFTTDENPPGGCDYAECGSADAMFGSIPADFIVQAGKDCEKFQSENREDLDEWLDMLRIDGYDEASAGGDLWYSRNSHGVGFFDRSTGSSLGDKLQDKARSFGEHYLELID